MKFCRRCGTPLEKYTETEYRCQNNHRVFEGSLPAIGCFFVNSKNEVLLVTRGGEPAKGKLDSPGGFVDAGETLEETVARELQEELNVLPGQYGKPQFLCSAINDYQFDGEVAHPLDVFFWARVDDGFGAVAGDDAAAVGWYPINDIRRDDIAFKTVWPALELLKTHL